MKNLKILIFVVGFLMSLNVSSQNLKNDCDFFKSTTYMLSTSSYFDDIQSDSSSKMENIKLIESNIEKLKSLNLKLKLNYSNDEDYKAYKSWYDVTLRTLDLLKKENDMWVMAYTLLKMDINEFLQKKY